MEGVPEYPKQTKDHYYKQRLWWGLGMGEALDRMGKIYPNKIALVDEAQRFTYSELCDLTSRLALGLTELGLKNGDRVLMQLPNIAELAIFYLAFQRIGVVPVMGVPRHAQKEMEHFGQLAEVVAWIGVPFFRKTDYLPVAKEIKEKVKSLKHMILVDEISSPQKPGYLSYHKLIADLKFNKYATDHLKKFRPDPEEPCHLMPTGGTTGLPKLVPRTHNNYLCGSYFTGTGTARSPRDSDLVVTPLGHNAGLARVAARLVWGGTLVTGNSTRPRDILELAQREKVTNIFLVPTLVIDLLQEPELDRFNLASLAYISTGGATIPVEVLKEFKRRLGCLCFNIFGMSEGPTIGPHWDYPEEEIYFTVGKPFCPWEKDKLVDEEGKEVSGGMEGEIAAKGPMVFTGYYKAEESNKKSFTSDGFFLTGDLARINDRGNYIITGRRKDLINRGGEKISAAEVEEMLISLEGIIDAAAVAMPDPRMGEKVCAYIKAKKGYSFNLEKVTSPLKSQGASVLLLPERVEMIDEMPLTAIGKIDKKELRQRIAEKLARENK